MSADLVFVTLASAVIAGIGGFVLGSEPVTDNSVKKVGFGRAVAFVVPAVGRGLTVYMDTKAVHRLIRHES